MNANDVIESYVTEVAVRLPRKQRNDVAFELRALLNEGLQEKADAAGRPADAAMAIELAQAFGGPAEVAARYRPTLTIIDPADGHRFLRMTVVGLAIIWCLGLWERLLQPIDSTAELLGVIAQWWLGTVIASLWWPGLLVAGFAAAAWTRRRSAQTSVWKPNTNEIATGSRAGMVLGLVGIAFGIFVLIEPRWVLDIFWSGRAAPAAYAALTYTDTFRMREGLWLLALLVLNIPLFLVVILSGRWSTTLRRMQDALSLALCAAMAWAVLAGPIFIAPVADQTAKFLMALIVVGTLIGMGIKLHRRVRPTPDGSSRVWR